MIEDVFFIKCCLPPIEALGRIGHLTGWPKSEPPENRNVSMKCKVHGKKCNVARRRIAVTDEMLIVWLLKAVVPPPDASPAVVDELIKEHKAQWVD